VITTSRKIQDPPRLVGKPWDNQTQRDVETYLRRVREALDGEAELRQISLVVNLGAAAAAADNADALSFFRGGC